MRAAGDRSFVPLRQFKQSTSNPSFAARLGFGDGLRASLGTRSMSERPINSIAIFFARLSWMIFGPLMLLLLLSAIWRSTEGGIAGADFAYFGIVAAMIACRFYEFRSGEALTARGDPMTSAVMARYALIVAVLGFVAYAGVKALANGILNL
jgi:hypothetical protein